MANVNWWMKGWKDKWEKDENYIFLDTLPIPEVKLYIPCEKWTGLLLDISQSKDEIAKYINEHVQ